MEQNEIDTVCPAMAEVTRPIGEFAHLPGGKVLVTEPMLLHADLSNDPRMIEARKTIDELRSDVRRLTVELADQRKRANEIRQWWLDCMDENQGLRLIIARLRARGQEPEPKLVEHDWTRAHRETW